MLLVFLTKFLGKLDQKRFINIKINIKILMNTYKPTYKLFIIKIFKKIELIFFKINLLFTN